MTGITTRDLTLGMKTAIVGDIVALDLSNGRDDDDPQFAILPDGELRVTLHVRLADNPTPAERRAALVKVLQKSLVDVETGPLSDTPYRDADVNDEGNVDLYAVSRKEWPESSVDVQQLADEILAGVTP
ncbi:hypothetical protein [Microbacterium trichothecenolyticum]|uniref:Uncharacterized protein n=1 Tax=Microbacterium trichothecenolyticum TaxID=69370 RepID=A0A0M2HMC5_MICTR|nr:hypothetical protein [Microbacterium trichothecenolyticum]KJL45579.1 hypothetical protein RS82_00131 [Microbacterium trichothecenolyticum]